MSKLGKLKSTGLDIIIGVTIDVIAEVVKKELDEATFKGQFAALAIKELKVGWAGRKGIQYAILEAAALSTGQVTEVISLASELKKITKDDDIKKAISVARKKASELRSKYKKSSKNQKNGVEKEIRKVMKEVLIVKGGIFSSEKEIPNAAKYIEHFISTLKDADEYKYKVAHSLIKKIKENSNNADAYAKHARKFIKESFYNDGSSSSNNKAGGFYLNIDTAFKEVEEENMAKIEKLFKKAKKVGLEGLDEKDKTKLINLAKGISRSQAPAFSFPSSSLGMPTFKLCLTDINLTF